MHCESFSTAFIFFQSSNPPFTSVELDHSDSGREGCTVTTLTVTAEPKNWQNAIKVAVQEVCCFAILCIFSGVMNYDYKHAK